MSSGWYNIDDHGPPVFEPYNKTVRISDAFGLGKRSIIFSDDITIIRNSVMRNKNSRYNENLILKSGGKIALIKEVPRYLASRRRMSRMMSMVTKKSLSINC